MAPAAVAALRFWIKRTEEMNCDEVCGAPPQKVFKSKLGLPSVGLHRQPPADFWEKFPANRNFLKPALISAVRLRSLAAAAGVVDMERVELVCSDLTKGADIGCVGAARTSTASKNASSCSDYPDQITEAVAGWVIKGFAAGPFRKDEVPAGAKISGIMCRPKPNGAVRVILNLSAPAGVSVNDGIDASLFPATMSSTAKWLLVLNKAGRGALMTKVDWADRTSTLRSGRQTGTCSGSSGWTNTLWNYA